MNREMIYLDNAASTPVDPSVLEVVRDCQASIFGNPSAPHEAGRRARVVVEQSRRTIARLFRVAPAEVFFTSGGTEANNAILTGCVRDLGVIRCIVSRQEHPSVLRPLEAMQKNHGLDVRYVDTDNAGHINLDHLEELLSGKPSSLVSLMHANNETGNLLPVNAVSVLCRKYGALFHSDAVQTAGKFDLDLPRLGFDFVSASAHKFHGPKGVGCMVVRSGNFFLPFVRGGGQERNMRAGTENVCGIAGMARALEVAHERMNEDRSRIQALKEACIRLLQEGIPGISFNGDAPGRSLHTILNVSLPAGVDGEMLLPRLDMEGVCISAGSACASGSTKGSHVLEALGVDMARASLRISFSRHNSLEEVERLVSILQSLAASST